MAMNKEQKLWHEVYENLEVSIKTAVDDSYKAVHDLLKSRTGKPMANDDRAEQLIADITRYYITSQYENGYNIA